MKKFSPGKGSSKKKKTKKVINKEDEGVDFFMIPRPIMPPQFQQMFPKFNDYIEKTSQVDPIKTPEMFVPIRGHGSRPVT